MPTKPKPASRLPQQPKAIPFTKEGYEKVKVDLAELQSKRPEAVENLRKAREMGDLSENGYYKAARARLSELDARIRRLTIQVRYGKVVQNMSADRVGIGCVVKVTDGTVERSFEIVGGYESDPVQGKISHVSPIGRALLGKIIGDKVRVMVPAGEKIYTILSISLAAQ